jgi:TolA-binding protein
MTTAMARILPTTLSLLLLAAASTSCVTMEQHQALERELDRVSKELEARGRQLDEVHARHAQAPPSEQAIRESLAKMGARVESIELDTAEGRGIAETSVNELAAIKQNLSEMRVELDRRISEIASKVGQVTDLPEGKKELLAEAERLLKAKDYRQARRLFRTYLSRYPDEAAAPEVRFNIGLTLYSERDYRSALGEFYWIVQNAKSSPLVHDALYYSGLAFAKLGECEKALAYFNALVKKDSKAPDKYKQSAQQQIDTLSKDTGQLCSDREPKDDATPPSPAGDGAAPQG